MIISFAKTINELINGKKIATRRNWNKRTYQTICRQYDKGMKIHSAYNKSPRNGGKRITMIALIQRPFYQRLSNMTKVDLIEEGGMCKTIDEFCELIDMELEDEVVVIKFKVINGGHNDYRGSNEKESRT